MGRCWLVIFFWLMTHGLVMRPLLTELTPESLSEPMSYLVDILVLLLELFVIVWPVIHHLMRQDIREQGIPEIS